MTTNNSPERAYFDRLIALERERQSVAADIKDIYDEARDDPDCTVDLRVLKAAVKMALEDEEKRRKRSDLERAAEDLLARLGQLADTPLGQAAMQAAQ